MSKSVNVIFNEERLKNSKMLIIGSGGVKGMYLLGALTYIVDNDLIKNIKLFCGISVGSIISLLICIGMHPREIYDLFIENSTKIFNFENISIEKIIDQMGIFSTEYLLNVLSSVLIKKYNYIPTLNNLYTLTGKSLETIAFNASKRTIIRFNRHDHENLSVLDAVKFSTSIPGLLSQSIYDGDVIIDGAIVCPNPIYLYPQDIKAYGLYITEKINKKSLHILEIPKSVIECLQNKLHNFISKNFNYIHIEIEIESINDTLGLFIDEPNLKKMFVYGKIFIEERLKRE
jgi:patatin-like phospholipase/acyl hydrolase